MSFILDALKKSESDRQRQSGPSLFEVKVAPPRRTLPVWAVAIAVLLAINIVVVSWMLLRRPATQSRATAASAASAPSAAPAGPAAAGQSFAAARAAATPREPGSGAVTSTPAASAAPAPGPSVSAAQPAGADHTTAPAVSSSSQSPAAPLAHSADQSGNEQGAGDNPADHAPAVEPDTASASSGSAGQDLPLYQQIVTSAGLPDLHLDLHVYADRPQDRFVMINMHRLGEGDALPNGVQVESIRPDGVVMTYHGTRFLLPRN